MELTISDRTHDDLTVVTVAGEIDVFQSPKLREHMRALIEDGRHQIVLDLNDVEFLDSTGLGVVVGIYHRLRTVGGSLVLVGANERVRRVFHITKLTSIFTLYPTLDAALEAAR